MLQTGSQGLVRDQRPIGLCVDFGPRWSVRARSKIRGPSQTHSLVCHGVSFPDLGSSKTAHYLFGIIWNMNVKKRKSRLLGKCPRCKSTKGQVRNGKNQSGTQRAVCNSCKRYYTIHPKRRGWFWNPLFLQVIDARTAG